MYVVYILYKNLYFLFSEKYSSIECDLQREFINGYKINDLDVMAKCARTLLPFKVIKHLKKSCNLLTYLKLLLLFFFLLFLGVSFMIIFF